MKPAADFSFKTYEWLLDNIRGNGPCRVCTLEQFMGRTGDGVLILRHDVDRNPQNALRMARLENQASIKASYYFRMTRNSFQPRIIREIVRLGHEIGYHYEDLAVAGGDAERAIRSFAANLARLREFYPVRTMCMHGSPLSRWDNRQLWAQYDYREFDIGCEPYLDLDFNRLYYLTDASRAWNNKEVTVRDRVVSRFRFPVASSYDFIALFLAGALPSQIMLNIHPHNWAAGKMTWLKILVLQQIKNAAKRLLIRHAHRPHP